MTNRLVQYKLNRVDGQYHNESHGAPPHFRLRGESSTFYWVSRVFSQMSRVLPMFLILGIMATAHFLVPVSSALAQTSSATNPAAGLNSIDGVSVSQQGGVVLVKVSFKSPPSALPIGFLMSNPSRLVLDFLNTLNGTGQVSQELGVGDLFSYNVVEVGGRSRVVLNLKNPVIYNTQITENLVVISLSPIGGTLSGSADKPSGTTFAPPPTPPGGLATKEKDALRDIDFRRTADGTGRLLVELGSSATGVDVRQQGQSLVIDFQKNVLPSNLRRRLDVTDFGTPVQTINAFQQGDNVRLVVEPKGLWEYNAYQTNNQFFVEIKPVKEDPNKLVQGSRGGYSGDKLSLNFQNIEIRAVLSVIADFTGLNIIAPESVNGSLTLRLKEVPWDQALDIILQTRGLEMRKNGNVVWIAPRDEILSKEKQDLDQRSQISDLEPLRTETFVLNYSTAALAATVLKEAVSKRGKISSDIRTNQLFVQDTPTRLEDIRLLIAKIDIPVRQVLIEARIVEAEDNFSRNLGARFGISGTGNPLGRSARATVGGELGAAGTAPAAATGTGVASVAFSPANLSFSGAGGAQNSGGGGQGAGVFSLVLGSASSNRLIGLELSALETDQRGKIVSSPRVLTADKNQAVIEQGQEVPYLQASSSGATSVSFKKATLSLKVKPQITPEGNVIMDLEVNKDSVGASTSAGPSINTKQVKTQALVENGGTVVIGGIYTQDERNDLTKVPFFGDLPLFGNLFRTTGVTNRKTELLVFVTPRVIDNRLNLK